MWPKETEMGKMLQKGYKVMGRVPEKAREVGAVPGLPGESNSEVSWGRPQLTLGPLCPLSLLQGWAELG